MVFIVKKVGKKSYEIRNKFSGVVKATRSSYSAAQDVANDLNRRQRSEGAEFVTVSAPRGGKYA